MSAVHVTDKHGCWEGTHQCIFFERDAPLKEHPALHIKKARKAKALLSCTVQADMQVHTLLRTAHNYGVRAICAAEYAGAHATQSGFWAVVRAAEAHG